MEIDVFFWRAVIKKNSILLLMSFSFICCMEENILLVPEVTYLVGENIDDLILKGIKNIKDKGELFEARAGSGQQAYDVNYTLLNPLNRVHTLREQVSRRYFCRELFSLF